MSNDEVDFDKIATASPNPESVLIAQANRELVRQGLTDLPLPYREILLLCEVEEMSYEDIAQVLAVPLGTVMSRLHRARKALHALMAEKFKKAPDNL